MKLINESYNYCDMKQMYPSLYITLGECLPAKFKFGCSMAPCDPPKRGFVNW